MGERAPLKQEKVIRPLVNTESTRNGLPPEVRQQISAADRQKAEEKRRKEIAAAERGKASLRAVQEAGRRAASPAREQVVMPERSMSERSLLVNERVAVQATLDATSWVFFWKKPALRQRIAELDARIAAIESAQRAQREQARQRNEARVAAIRGSEEASTERIVPVQDDEEDELMAAK